MASNQVLFSYSDLWWVVVDENERGASGTTNGKMHCMSSIINVPWEIDEMYKKQNREWNGKKIILVNSIGCTHKSNNGIQNKKPKKNNNYDFSLWAIASLACCSPFFKFFFCVYRRFSLFFSSFFSVSRSWIMSLFYLFVCVRAYVF